MSTLGPLLAVLLLAAAACSGAREPAEPRPATGRETPAATPAADRAGIPAAPAAPAAELTGDRARIPGLATRAARGDRTALESLSALAAEDPEGAVGDHAALVLASLHLDRGEPATALPLLRRAARGHVAPDYARLLFARAVIEGGAEDAVAEAHDLLLPVQENAETPALGAAVRLRLMQLAARSGAWAESARWGRELLARGATGVALAETRWLTAEALRLAGQGEAARGLYRAIWLETPGSPWGTRARDQLAELGERTAPPAGERLPWVATLQSAGLHRDALDALAPLLAGGLTGEERAHALALAARSHFVLRENDRVVERAAVLRREHPGSPHAARAAMEAIRALGRNDQTAEIRAWEAWLREHHPQHEAAHEARYYLGTHLGSLPAREQEGVAVLRDLAAAGGTRAPDALWRIAWIARRGGDTTAARSTLEALLAGHPDTGYRAAGLYWLARWATPADGPRARELYRTVRREYPRDYYGRLAAERLTALGEDLAPLPGTGPAPPHDPLTDPRRRPELAYRRAVELNRLGLPALAADELVALDTADDPPLDLARTWLLARAGDTWTAIGELSSRYGEPLRREPLGAPGVPDQIWRTLYPFPYRDALEAAVRRRAPGDAPFDPFLLAALARRESRFWPRAASGAGAVGLLQLMPQTAAATARRLGLPAPDRAELFDPTTNLELGTALLASHVREFAGEWAPAIASYNAGETVVRGWWAGRPPGQAVDEWIETIPYVETRLYVKAILGDYRNYRELYGAEAAVAAERQATGAPGRPRR